MDATAAADGAGASRRAAFLPCRGDSAAQTVASMRSAG